MVKWIKLFLIKRELKKLLKEMDASDKSLRHLPLIEDVIVQAYWKYVGDQMYPYITVYCGSGIFKSHVFLERSKFELDAAALTIYELSLRERFTW